MYAYRYCRQCVFSTCYSTDTDPRAYTEQCSEKHPPIHPKVHLHPGFSLTQAQYLPHAEVTGRSACLTWSRIPLWLAPAIPLICVTGPDRAASLHPSLLSSPSSGCLAPGPGINRWVMPAVLPSSCVHACVHKYSTVSVWVLAVYVHPSCTRAHT